MKPLLIFLSILLISCDKETTTPNASTDRKPDPLTTGATVTYLPATNWNVTWDTTAIGGNYPTTLIEWNAQSGADRYYLLIEGTGNGSCSKQVVINGITYYYPWLYSDVPNRVLLSRGTCAASHGNNYNLIVLYYRFQQGTWKGYSSNPINFPL